MAGQYMAGRQHDMQRVGREMPGIESRRQWHVDANADVGPVVEACTQHVTRVFLVQRHGDDRIRCHEALKTLGRKPMTADMFA